MRKHQAAFGILAVAAIAALGSSQIFAAPFAPLGPITESTQSLGQFTIVVNPAFAGAMPGLTPAGFTYDAGKNILTSPLLYDPTTTIDRSATTTVGSAAYIGGLPVGSPA